LNKADVRSGLLAWADRPNAPVAAVMEQTGLSRQRVSNAKQWALLGNFLDQKGLTPEGKLALQKDPYLETTVTDWRVHLIGSFDGQNSSIQPQSLADWDIWAHIVYSFLPEHSTFTKEELFQYLAQYFDSDKLENPIKVLLKTYTEASAIANSAFLTRNGDTYATGNPNLENVYTVGYVLATIWQQDIGDQVSVLVDELLNSPVGLGKVLGLDSSQVRDQLDRLTEAEIIEQRSAKPHAAGQTPLRRQSHETNYVVVRCWDNPLELLEKAYDQDSVAPNRPLIQALDGILDDEDGELPFLSSMQNWFSNLRPQQSQFAPEGSAIDTLLHLAG